MAIPIKEVPILSGTLADEFVRRAEEREERPRRITTPLQRAVVAEMERQLREFVPDWKR